MRRVFQSVTTFVAVVSMAVPPPLYAQGETADLPTCGADIPLPCLMEDGSVMNDERVAAEAQAAEAQAAADAAAAAQAEAEAQAAAAAQAEAEAAAAAQAAAEAQAAADAQAQADEAARAAAEAQAAADAAAAAEAEAAAQAEAAAAAEAAAIAEAEAQAIADAEAAAAKAAADAAAAEAQTEAEAAAQAEVDAAAAAQAEADAAAQAAADAATAAAAAATQASSDAATVAKDAADVSAENAGASSDAAATDAAAQTADEATAEPAPAEEPVVEEAPAEEPVAEEEAVTDEAPAEEATSEEAVAPDAEPLAEGEVFVGDGAPAEIVIDDPEVAAELEALAEEQAAADAAVEVSPEIAATLSEVADLPLCAEGVPFPCLAEDGAVMTEELAAMQADAEAAAEAEAAEIAAQVAETPPEPVVENTEPTEDAGLTEDSAAAEVASVETDEPEAPSAAVAAAVAQDEGATEAPTPDAVALATATEVVTGETMRSSNEEFARITADEPGKKKKFTNLEKILLIGIGAVIVGKILNDKGDKVVDNSGDRVTVQRPDGTYYVLRDDDVLLRQDGNVVQTQTFNDGSTITLVTKPNGEQVKTIRDATGRVLRRSRILPDGREYLLFDDTVEVERIDVSELPRESAGTVVLSNSDDELEAALQDALAGEFTRRYSLYQIRNVRAVRELVPVIDIQQITFDSGSAAIKPEEAKKLAKLGLSIQKALKKNPGAVFLIEGHTDATGAATLNLRLSDRRAESLALALTEYFNVPPENLVVQGYGETYLKVATLENERLNRRVAVRDITRLIGADELALR